MEWVLILAAVLPFVAAVSAKLGGKGFSNQTPRDWLAKQEGWRARANAAQANSFEALPFFYAAVLFSLYRGVDEQQLMTVAFLWLALRLAYIWMYVRNKASIRSLVWFAAVAVNVYILFLPLVQQ